MKTHLFIFSIIASLLLCACHSKQYDECYAVASKVVEADTITAELITEVAAKYDSIYKSSPDSASMREAFLDCADQTDNDTVEIVLKTIIYSPDVFGQLYAEDIAQPYSMGQVPSSKIFHRLSIIQWVCSITNKTDYMDTFNSTFQKYIDGLDIETQMKIYVHTVSPDVLGTALRLDREKADADTNLINKQISTLKQLYSPEQFDSLMLNYNINH